MLNDPNVYVVRTYFKGIQTSHSLNFINAHNDLEKEMAYMCTLITKMKEAQIK